MVGSAACRHLSSGSLSVVGIGPSEPLDWKSHTEIFASHYDQGRITRIVDRDTVWSKLAARSINSYEQIEKESGISFHGKVGSLRVSPFYGQEADSLAKSLQVGTDNGACTELINGGDALKFKFPYLQFKSEEVGAMEYGGAGYINPRETVKAQLEAAQRRGVSILRELVTKIEPFSDGVRIFTNGESMILAKKVLICTEAYTNFILPGRKLDLRTQAVSILLAEIASDEQRRLQGMPSFIWRLDAHPFLHSVYGCPPVVYPDGKTYVKIGGTAWEPRYVSNREEFLHWFHSDGAKDETEALLDVLTTLLPGLSIKSLATKPCVVSYTAHGYPYIDSLDDEQLDEARIFVAVGGCGASAKSSDEIARMACLLVENGKWSYDLDAALFKAVFLDETET
ncbi:hypothetical protein O6H91_16G054000 [Diphasiastrum complanatum]|nr:hypothetical protein O6H91_Y319600 [Diphasiastrum complanatum]KAJ7286724.1 hypothetical protein O6H91_Y319600 [Diphasiastrum complanatum]KAJ7286727.1 hypothetical protein O6H91_Y319600 [Diphasiastrum complanatum]KAJ7527430.1 hypothetical protein O6H91_16G054000 [Diphasiastrum complanatum]KAJ7527432.1 hypothetical protein O6H91_16G054000 [Diphasiastrum complanatum]